VKLYSPNAVAPRIVRAATPTRVRL